MAECKDCIYHKMCYWVATFNEETPCEHFISTADVVPKSEVERLKHILNCYALQYGTVVDQQRVIDEAKAEVAREIFAEIERETKNHGIAYTQRKIAELKKKYTEDKQL